MFLFDKWDSDTAGAFRLSERNISIDLLGEIEIKGKTFPERSHILNEQFKVKPIRVKMMCDCFGLCDNNRKIRIYYKDNLRDFIIN